MPADAPQPFADRAEAGRRLADALAHLAGDLLVLGIPRGGVVLAAAVADRLGAELDVVVARKLGHPAFPEFGVGAIAPGVRVLDEAAVEQMQQSGVELADLEAVEARERRELDRRVAAFRTGRPPLRVAGRTVVVVDDGVATSVTARAALRSIRAGNPARLVFAAPVASRDAARALADEADEVILLEQPEPFVAVGAWYRDFQQVEDEEVVAALARRAGAQEREVRIDAIPGTIVGTLRVPPNPLGAVVFAHGSGSSRHSPRNRQVAQALERRGLATLLLDLLTPEEERVDVLTREHRFDIQLLARRLESALAWLAGQDALSDLGVGLFGSSTGAAAALVAASRHPEVRAVVSRGGRADLAGAALPEVRAPTLLIVGGSDDVVLQLNQEAREQMAAPCELEVVPGATHLFEEPGALATVGDRAGDWFLRHLRRRSARGIRPVSTGERVGAGLGRLLTQQAMTGLVERMARRRIVLMGEATHGTHEFYALRAQLTLKLVREHGFDFVAVEGDWPACFAANRWAKGDPGLAATAEETLAAFTRWPTWMWANRDVAEFLRQLRHWNLAAAEPAGFYGLDVYSLWDSLHATLGYLEKVGSDAADAARAALACFEPYAPDPHLYARHAAWVPASCRDEVVQALAATRASLAKLPDGATEARLDAEQNAVVAHDAETYYRAWAQGGPASWNVRDRHMLDTLTRLLDHHTAQRGRPAKAIVWAHNTHVGDARATDMREDGMVNLGQLARESFPGEVFALGFTSYAGTVVAGRAWEAPARAMTLPPARPGSLEARLHEAGGDRLLVLPQDLPLRSRIGHRAVGVVYTPEREAGNYVPTTVRERYDALLHVDRTTALEPLGVPAEPEEVPETWPWNT